MVIQCCQTKRASVPSDVGNKSWDHLFSILFCPGQIDKGRGLVYLNIIATAETPSVLLWGRFRLFPLRLLTLTHCT